MYFLWILWNCESWQFGKTNWHVWIFLTLWVCVLSDFCYNDFSTFCFIFLWTRELLLSLCLLVLVFFCAFCEYHGSYEFGVVFSWTSWFLLCELYFTCLGMLRNFELLGISCHFHFLIYIYGYPFMDLNHAYTHVYTDASTYVYTCVYTDVHYMYIHICTHSSYMTSYMTS